MTGERDEDIKPEYLTTASVCYSFLNRNLPEEIIVRAEERISSLWRKILLPTFLKNGFKTGLKAAEAYELIRQVK